jgi:hypothetical protein
MLVMFLLKSMFWEKYCIQYYEKKKGGLKRIEQWDDWQVELFASYS